MKYLTIHNGNIVQVPDSVTSVSLHWRAADPSKWEAYVHFALRDGSKDCAMMRGVVATQALEMAVLKAAFAMTAPIPSDAIADAEFGPHFAQVAA